MPDVHFVFQRSQWEDGWPRVRACLVGGTRRFLAELKDFKCDNTGKLHLKTEHNVVYGPNAFDAYKSAIDGMLQAADIQNIEVHSIWLDFWANEESGEHLERRLNYDIRDQGYALIFADDQTRAEELKRAYNYETWLPP